MIAWPPPAWEVPAFLEAHPTLGIVAGPGDKLHIGGALAGPAAGPDNVVVELDYRIEMSIDRAFPKKVPAVRETGGRIPRTYHTLDDGSACLGSPLRLRSLALAKATIGGFFDAVVLPYFWGHAFWTAHGRMPLGELRHGSAGVTDDYSEMLGAQTPAECRRTLVALSLRRRVANKQPCPCGSGVRLGRCHARRVNGHRRLGPRSMFALAIVEVDAICAQEAKPARRAR